MSRKESTINREVLWEKLGYTPHSAAQYEFHDSGARFRSAVCGRRFGKSTMAAIDLIEACFIPDAYYWICGPTYKLAEKEFRIVHNAFTDRRKLNMSDKIKSSNNVKQGDMRITFPWNTVVECVSATNPDSLLGEGLHGVIMSEAAEHSLETWESRVEPALSDNLGWATFPTTPKGFNWIHALWQFGQMPNMKDYASWQYPTWLNNAKFPGGFREDCLHIPGICECNQELVRIFNIVSRSYWEQQYAAKFTNIAGSIYDEFDERIHVKDIEYNPAWKNFWVFDHGFTAPFVCLDIMVDPDDNVYVWREYQVKYLSSWEHGHALLNRWNPPNWRLDGMFADPAGADSIANLTLVLGQIFSAQVPWEQGVEAVRRGLKIQPNGLPKLYIDRGCVELIRQMMGLRRKPEKEGLNPKEGQVDYDDHGPDALRYFYSQYYILGAGSSLSDVYHPTDRSESHSYFTEKTQMVLDTKIGYD